MSRIACETAREKLAEYQLGALAASEHATVDAHVEACEDCRADLRALEATAEALSRTELRRPTRDLWPGVAARLSPRRQAWWRALLPTARMWPAHAAAALLVVLVVGAALHGGPVPTPAPIVELPLAADAEAALFSGWHAEASMSSGMADTLALALVVQAEDRRLEAADPL